MNKKPINPFAAGTQFLDYCVKQGWLTQEGAGRNKKWFVTEKGEDELNKNFGINIKPLSK